jgi:hypothetical protein
VRSAVLCVGLLTVLWEAALPAMLFIVPNRERCVHHDSLICVQRQMRTVGEMIADEIEIFLVLRKQDARKRAETVVGVLANLSILIS